jgi:hypothetical protein
MSDVQTTSQPQPAPAAATINLEQFVPDDLRLNHTGGVHEPVGKLPLGSVRCVAKSPGEMRFTGNAFKSDYDVRVVMTGPGTANVTVLPLQATTSATVTVTGKKRLRFDMPGAPRITQITTEAVERSGKDGSQLWITSSGIPAKGFFWFDKL